MVGFTDSDGTPLSGGSSNYAESAAAKFPPPTSGRLRSTRLRTPQGSPTASLSRRWARATSRHRMPTEHGPLPRSRNHRRAKAPTGSPTVPGRGYFAILRLYGPTEAAIDKSWKPGDIEKTN